METRLKLIFFFFSVINDEGYTFFKLIVKFVVIFYGIMVAICCNFMREFDDFSKFLPHFSLPDSIFLST